MPKPSFGLLLDEQAKILDTFMHELGHNMGLQHSSTPTSVGASASPGRGCRCHKSGRWLCVQGCMSAGLPIPALWLILLPCSAPAAGVRRHQQPHGLVLRQPAVLQRP